MVAAAVVLNPKRPIIGVRDSKLLTPAARERLSLEIVAKASAWGVSFVDVDEVDRLNVHQASLQAMRRAVSELVPLPDFVLVDGFHIPDLHLPQRRVVGGDRRCAAIAAASIIAKVKRDRYMCKLHALDPRYGFDRHKGYATAIHLDAMARFGYSRVHRRSFRPSALLEGSDAQVSRGDRGSVGR